jgi:hypothetical protein
MKKFGKKLAMNRVWPEIMNEINKHNVQIAKDLKNAKEKYPYLALSYEFNLGYVNHLKTRLQRFGVWVDMPGTKYTPWPPEPKPGRHRIPEDFCKFFPLDCKCINDGDRDACEEMIMSVETDDDNTEKFIDIFKRAPTCIDLKRDYKKALECAIEYASKENPTYEDLQKWTECQQEAERLWTELVENDCIDSGNLRFVVDMRPRRFMKMKGK